jgi:hypothetical protein
MDKLQLTPIDRRGLPGQPKSPEHRAKIAAALKRRNQETTVIRSESRCAKCAANDDACADHRSAVTKTGKAFAPMLVSTPGGDLMWVGKYANPVTRKARLEESAAVGARKVPKTQTAPPARKTVVPTPAVRLAPLAPAPPAPAPKPYVLPPEAGDMTERVDSHMRIRYDAPPKAKAKPVRVRVPLIGQDDGRRRVER